MSRGVAEPPSGRIAIDDFEILMDEYPIGREFDELPISGFAVAQLRLDAATFVDFELDLLLTFSELTRDRLGSTARLRSELGKRGDRTTHDEIARCADEFTRRSPCHGKARRDEKPLRNEEPTGHDERRCPRRCEICRKRDGNEERNVRKMRAEQWIEKKTYAECQT
ncbi:MAG: hypothetical protein QM784_40775 [Polyangiaceae bacterium]